MAYDIKWLKEYGLLTEEGIGYTGSEENYISALQRYLKGYEKYRAELDHMLEEGVLEDYQIRVHTLKSNSKMIGAFELSKKFADLEAAAGRKDLEYIRSVAPHVMSAYDELAAFLEPVKAMTEVHPSAELTEDEARETMGQLLEALDEFEDEVSKKLALKLLGYPFRITQREKLRQAISYIEDYLYDEAADCVRDLESWIEKK